MKILMPAFHYYPVVGGIETWTRHISQNVSKNAEVFVVTGQVKNQPKKEQTGNLQIIRTSFFVLKNLSHSPLIYTISLLPFIFFRSLIIIKKEKINISHCHGFLSSILGFCLSKITGVPYITTVQRLEFKRNPFKNFIYRNAILCIGASRAIGEYFKEIGCKNVEVIPNGIDLEKYKTLERKPHAGFVVMTIARLEKVKGINYLIEAAARSELRRRSDLQILVVGDGSERKNLENLVEKLGLKEKVKFLGEIPNEKIPEHLAIADCFVLPSTREGFGIVILEAQAAGVPVIGTKVGGILDLIEDQKTGLLVAPENPQAIAEAISKIYSGLKFPQISLEKYNWQNIADKVYQIYQRVL
ncbi:MAG: glycosyltransferase [Candidatus Nealsonbacteria bacterium]